MSLLSWWSRRRARIVSLWKTADRAQRALLTAIVLAGVLCAAWVISWCLRPDYEVLFSGLSPNEAVPILEELEDAGVRARVSENGRKILVESSRLGEMRIRIAAKGLAGENVDYDMFGKTGSERSALLEQASYRRALEAELARTVMSLDEVERARVHLAMGEVKTASLILELRPGAQLERQQLHGIRALIAASVEGLEPERVSLVDSSARLLGGPALAGGLATSDQLRAQREVEEYLREKAVTLLERAVGPGRAIVQVTAALDFDRVERDVETYNPATTSLRSEQRIAEPSDDSEDTILSTYEIDKTVDHILREVGSIQRLSVAVLIDGIETENIAGEMLYTERSSEELETLAAMVRSAVGFAEGRGDVFEIANLRFADAAQDAASPLPWWLFFPSLGSHWNSLIILLAMGLVAWGLRHSSTILVSTIRQERSRREQPGAPEKDDAFDSGLPVSGVRQQVNDLAHERPAEVASVVRRWLVEESAP